MVGEKYELSPEGASIGALEGVKERIKPCIIFGQLSFNIEYSNLAPPPMLARTITDLRLRDSRTKISIFLMKHNSSHCAKNIHFKVVR